MGIRELNAYRIRLSPIAVVHLEHIHMLIFQREQ